MDAVPVGSRSVPRRDLVLVTAGLGLDGGGRAVAGRLLARAGADWARARGAGFRLLDLGAGAPPGLEGLAVRSFAGRRAALAAAVARAQLGRRAPALAFDLLGLARVQALLPAALRSPYLVAVYGIEIWRALTWSRRRALAGAAVRIGISRAALDRARPFLPAHAGEVSVVPLCLEKRPPEGAPDAELVARLEEWGRGEPSVLIVGRMEPTERYKGHDELLEAWPAVEARLRELGARASRLVVAGGGEDRARLEARAAELGLGERVRFTGFVSEATLAELYRRASVFALPSRGEGFGLVYLEAMRAGKPCVALRGTAAAEIVVDGETGLLVPAGDAPSRSGALAAALAELLSDPERARRMGAAGRERWRSAFGYDRFSARLASHLDELTA